MYPGNDGDASPPVKTCVRTSNMRGRIGSTQPCTVANGYSLAALLPKKDQMQTQFRNAIECLELVGAAIIIGFLAALARALLIG